MFKLRQIRSLKLTQTEVHLQNSSQIRPEYFIIFYMLLLYFILMLLGCRYRTSLGLNSGIIFHILFLYFILMRLGCRDRTPLGMNSGYIATSQLSSSGTFNRRPNYHINYARLAIKLAEWRIQDLMMHRFRSLVYIEIHFTKVKVNSQRYVSKLVFLSCNFCLFRYMQGHYPLFECMQGYSILFCLFYNVIISLFPICLHDVSSTNYLLCSYSNDTKRGF